MTDRRVCNVCGEESPKQYRFCAFCKRPFPLQEVSEWVEEERRKRRYKATVEVGGGIVCVLLGLSIYLWVSQHSPRMGFGEALVRSGDYYIKEPLYSVFVLFAAGLGLVGIVVLVLGLAAQAKGQ